MISLYPSSSPPPYTESLMDPYHPFASLHLKWPVDQFCRALHTVHADSKQHGIVSVQHWKCLHRGLHHESLVLDVVPLVPGKNVPQNNPSHTYIQIGRFKDRVLLGRARDEVVVVGRMTEDVQESNQQGPSDCLSTISWTIELPNLLDVFDIIQLLSFMFPYHNIFTRQCHWFARTIYDCLEYAYIPYRQDTGRKLWKRSKFLLFRCLTPSPPPALLSYCRVKKLWSQDARPHGEVSSCLPRTTIGRVRGSVLDKGNTKGKDRDEGAEEMDVSI